MTRHRSNAFTAATLTPDQHADLRALHLNQHHYLAPLRRKLLHRLGLITPTEPPRSAGERRGKRPARAHALTEAGLVAMTANEQTAQQGIANG